MMDAQEALLRRIALSELRRFKQLKMVISANLNDRIGLQAIHF